MHECNPRRRGGRIGPIKVIQSWADKHSFSNICIPLATNSELNSLSTNNSIFERFVKSGLQQIMLEVIVLLVGVSI